MKQNNILLLLFSFLNVSTFCDTVKNFRKDNTEIQATIFHISQLSDKQIAKINRNHPEAVQGWRYCTLEEEAQSHNEPPQFFKYKKDKTWTERKIIGYKTVTTRSCNHCSLNDFKGFKTGSQCLPCNLETQTVPVFGPDIEHPEHLYFNDFELLKQTEVKRLVKKTCDFDDGLYAAILLGGFAGSCLGKTTPKKIIFKGFGADVYADRYYNKRSFNLSFPTFFIPLFSSLAFLFYNKRANYAQNILAQIEKKLSCISEKEYLLSVQDSQKFDALPSLEIKPLRYTLKDKIKFCGIPLAVGAASLLIKTLIENSFSNNN